MSRKKLKHIELFAGCGGLNLGLETAGFELFFANEISPMAGETFAYNFLNEDLDKLSLESKISEKVLWVNSDYEKENLKGRLKENPFEGKKKHNDLTNEVSLDGKLLIGNIDKLLAYLKKSKKYKGIRDLNIDILSGGPPCQSFSLAGKREKNNEKNSLPLSFAKFAGLTKPKVILLENVKGITSPFSEDDGRKHYAWLEVSKAFALEGYYPICMMLNSKYYGVPQNRPRFILLAYRKDVFSKLKQKYRSPENSKILSTTQSFFNKVKEYKIKLNEVTVGDFKYFDIENEPELFDGTLLPKITNIEENFVTVEDAIDDLLEYSNKESLYKERLNNYFKSSTETTKLLNFEIRKHSIITKARFRYYQNLESLPLEYKKKLLKLLTIKETTDKDLSSLFEIVKNYNYLLPDLDQKNLEERKLRDFKQLKELSNIIGTKKRSQRALKRDFPAPAQLTIPDDICHYDFQTPRTLTVREMARIQSFPDWFEFKSKVTTGGDLRKFEVPQYTQVGNAVPPLLAYHLGIFIKKQIKDVS
ncbi:MAG: DNA cytosine methyltransferase [Gelidibacter sp.]